MNTPHDRPNSTAAPMTMVNDVATAMIAHAPATPNDDAATKIRRLPILSDSFPDRIAVRITQPA